jgi:hypothetical protein
MPLSPLTRQTRREEHTKNDKADIIYRIITNKKRSPKPSKPSPSKSPRTPSKSPSPSKKPPSSPKPKHKPSPPSNTSLPPVSLRDLPDDVLRKLALINYKSLLTTYKLRDWIPLRKIVWSSLSVNPNAIDFLSMPENKKHIDYHQLCKNTNPRALILIAEEIMRNPNSLDINWNELSRNPDAIDILDTHRHKIKWLDLCGNTHPKAIQILKENQLAKANGDDDIYWEEINMNTSTETINFLHSPENRRHIDWKIFSTNTSPLAIELLTKKESEEYELDDAPFNRLKDNQRISWKYLSANPKAISLLEKKWEDEKFLKGYDMPQYKKLKKKEYIINWNEMSSNPSAIHLLREKIAEEGKMAAKEYEKLEDVEKVCWYYLSANEKAIKLLEENPTKIIWFKFSKNPKAIRLIEKELLVRPENVNWSSLSQNPEAIRILGNNKDKIVWSYFSSNPNAGELLKTQVEVEAKIPKKIYDNTSKYNMLDWFGISKNPSIFTY